nr:MAG TPA: hypothetical protein [Caudoviricetes sp.]
MRVMANLRTVVVGATIGRVQGAADHCASPNGAEDPPRVSSASLARGRANGRGDAQTADTPRFRLLSSVIDAD